MSKTAEVIEFDQAALDAWHKRLDAARGKSVDAIIAFGVECFEFQQACERKQGGSTYSTAMMEWFGIEKVSASQWATIGKCRAELFGLTKQLPPSMDVIYRLSALPPAVIESKVTPKTTQKEARAIVAEYRKTITKDAPERIGWKDAVIKVLGSEGKWVPNAKLGMKAPDGWRDEIKAEFGGEIPVYVEHGGEAERKLCDIVRTIYLKNEAKRDPQAAAQTAKDLFEAARMDLPETERQRFDRVVKKATEAIEAQYVAQYVEMEKALLAKIALDRAAIAEIKKEALAEAAEIKRKAFDHLSKGLTPYMTQDEFKLVLGCLHPDRAPEDKRDRYNEAFQIFKRLEGLGPKLPRSELRKRGWAPQR